MMTKKRQPLRNTPTVTSIQRGFTDPVLPLKGYGLLTYSYGIYQNLQSKIVSDNPYISYVAEGLELAPVILYLLKLDNVRLTEKDDVATAAVSPSADQIARAQAWLSRFPMLKDSLDTHSPLVYNFTYKDDPKALKEFGLSLTKTGNTFDIKLVTRNPVVEYYMSLLSMQSQLEFTRRFISNKSKEYKGNKNSSKFYTEIITDSVKYLMTETIIPTSFLQNPFKREAFFELLQKSNESAQATYSSVEASNKNIRDIIPKLKDDIGAVFNNINQFDNIKQYALILMNLYEKIKSMNEEFLSKKSSHLESTINFTVFLFETLYSYTLNMIRLAISTIPSASNALLLGIFQIDNNKIQIATEFLNGEKTVEYFVVEATKNNTPPIQYTTLPRLSNKSYIKENGPKKDQQHAFYFNSLSLLNLVSSERTPFSYGKSEDLTSLGDVVISFVNLNPSALSLNTLRDEILTNNVLTILSFTLYPRLFVSIFDETCVKLSEDMDLICNEESIKGILDSIALSDDMKNIQTTVFEAASQHESKLISPFAKIMFGAGLTTFLAYGTYRILKKY